jgi:uncharacterized membrane protein
MRFSLRNPFHPLRRASARRAIAAAVATAEATTSAEVIVRIRDYCDPGLYWCEDRDERFVRQAQADFVLAGADRTREGTGIVILIVLQERGFAVWAEKKVLEALGADKITGFAREIACSFSRGEFVEGVGRVIEGAELLLATKFPRKADDTNELPDNPVAG